METTQQLLGNGANAAEEPSQQLLGMAQLADRDHQITIGTKFVYLRFASTETEATVYNALSPWLNPTAGDGIKGGGNGVF